MKHFYTNREQCEVLTGYLSSGRRPGGDWAKTWHWTKFLQQSFQRRSSSILSYLHTFFLNAFLEETFTWNIIIILCIHYTITIIICINNNAIINNNYGMIQDIIVLLKIPMVTRKNFFEIYTQFGHAPSKRFANPGLGHGLDVRVITVWFQAGASDWMLLQHVQIGSGAHPDI